MPGSDAGMKFHYLPKGYGTYLLLMACGRPSNLAGNDDTTRTTCKQCRASTSWYEADYQRRYNESKGVKI